MDAIHPGYGLQVKTLILPKKPEGITSFLSGPNQKAYIMGSKLAAKKR
jgi:hypothetical protein